MAGDDFMQLTIDAPPVKRSLDVEVVLGIGVHGLAFVPEELEDYM